MLQEAGKAIMKNMKQASTAGKADTPPSPPRIFVGLSVVGSAWSPGTCTYASRAPINGRHSHWGVRGWSAPHPSPLPHLPSPTSKYC